jgi:PKD repeat protein
MRKGDGLVHEGGQREYANTSWAQAARAAGRAGPARDEENPMSRASANRRAVACLLVVVVCVGSPGVVAPAFAQATRFVHTPIAGFVPGFRINVRAAVSSPAGVAIVRCYFRTTGEADYVFVDMSPVGGDQYTGALPAPSQGTAEITYVLLAVSGDRAVTRTQAFTMLRQEGSQPTAWQTTNTSGQVSVSTDLAVAPNTVPGFTDGIAADIAESAFRFGYVVEGLYTVSQMAGPAPAGYQSAVSLASPASQPAAQAGSKVPAKPSSTPTSATAAATTSTAAAGGGMSTGVILGLVGLGVAATGAAVIVAVKKSDHAPTVSGVTASPSTGLQGSTPISFSAQASDQDNDPISYSWAFGDGSTSTEATPTHTYTSAGTFSATLTVTAKGKTVTGQTTVTIKNLTGTWRSSAAQYNTGGTLKGTIQWVLTATQSGTTVTGSMTGTTVTCYVSPCSNYSGTTTGSVRTSSPRVSLTPTVSGWPGMTFSLDPSTDVNTLSGTWAAGGGSASITFTRQ